MQDSLLQEFARLIAKTDPTILNPQLGVSMRVSNLPSSSFTVSTSVTSIAFDPAMFANMRPGGVMRVDDPDEAPRQVVQNHRETLEADVVLVDDRGRPHSTEVPAVILSDSRAMYFWHGVHVPEYVVKEPELITVAAIDAEQNLEIRRVMIERYGMQRYIEDCGAQFLGRDGVGELYGKSHAPDTWEPLRFVKVKNSTPEPDGSIKDYFIRVPPGTKTPREGIAWTFRLDEKTYSPERET